MKIKGSVRRFGKHMIVAAVVVSLGLAAGVIFSDRTEQPAKADPVPVAQTKWDFAYTGNYQTWTVPESGYYKFEAWGAEAYPAGAFSGKGAYTQGVLSLTQGETIYIYVGQGNNSAGGGTSYNGSAGTSGGWPGGGATDFRLVANANWRDFNSLKSRIMIAAGGGAGSGTNTSQGGYGGALTGGKGVGVAGGGTQTAGGTGGGYTASGFGFGGGGCGGGGGYYGGSGAPCANGGGGGSSFVSGYPGANAIAASSTSGAITHTGQPNHYSGKVFADTQMIAGNIAMPNTAGTGTEVGHAGHGFARITATKTKNQVRLVGDATININKNSVYTEQGAYAYYDDEYIDYSRLTVVGNLNVSAVGSYYITYSYRDIEASRRINVGVTPSVFPYTGGYQTFIAPEAGLYKFEAWGAQGYTGVASAARGGYSTGLRQLQQHDTFYVYVGQGNNQTGNGTSYNGSTGSSDGWPGGGATDFRLVANANWRDFNSLKSRVLVAGGGGSGSSSGLGGAGGGLTGLKGGSTANGGTQTAGGTGGGYTASGFGFGGGGCGGGGGYYGGSGAPCANGGGGGSSFVSGLTGANAITSGSTSGAISHTGQPNHYSGVTFTEAATIAGNANMPDTAGTGFETGNAGHGYAKVAMYFPKSSDANLKSLGVVGYVLDQPFNPNTTAYTLYIPDPFVLDARIIASANDPMATVMGVGNFTLAGGPNIFTVTVTAEDGTVKSYTVTITREPSHDPFPSDIQIIGLIPNYCALDDDYCILDPELDIENETMYTMTVPNKISSLTFKYTKAHPNQTIAGAGVVNLAQGVNVFAITVTAEDGINDTVYVFTITRDLPMDADIQSLTISNALDWNPAAFDPDVTEYFVTVDSATTSLNMNIVRADPNASHVVYGNSNFVTGLNDVIIKVTSVKGTEKVYILHVEREPDGNTYLSALSVGGCVMGCTMSPAFQKSIRNYTVTVPGDVLSVDLVGTPDAGTSSVDGLGTNKPIATGNNRFVITVTAQNDTTGIYTVNVIKPKSTNALLASLSAVEGTLSPTFDPNTLNYTMTVGSDVTSLDLTVVPQIPSSVYSVSGNKNFQMGNVNTVSITVKAESGAVKLYQIKVNREQSSNTYLSNLTVSAGTLSPVFNKNTVGYTVAVGNDVKNITVTGTREDSTSYVDGNGLYYLNVGANAIPITVTAVNGAIRTYTVTVTRAASNNANLVNILNDAGAIMTPNFSNSVDNYTINVANEVNNLSFVAIREDLTATVVGATTYSLIPGTNPVDITVTAEDGVTTNTFHIDVVRDYSVDANLKSVFVHEGVLEPSLDPMVIRYDLNLPNEYDHLNMDIATAFPGASYTVAGNENFVVGENIVTIRVTAEAGAPHIKDYTIYVNRQEGELQSNHLSSLAVNQGTLDPIFNRGDYVYDVAVGKTIDEITVTAVAEDPLATIVGDDTYQLNRGMNYLAVIVTSQDGKERAYQIRVYRQPMDDARLSALNLSGDSLNESFNSSLLAYTVNTYNTSLNLTPVPVDSDATYEVLGNSGFTIAGPNVVTVRVTAADGTTRLDYTITVNRLQSPNNNLASLTVSSGMLTPAFNKAIDLYSVNVANNINNILVTAVPEQPDATVSGAGVIALNVGLNIIRVTVTSQSGVSKDYILMITKAASTNNYLSALTVSDGELDPVFDRLTNIYDVEVDYETDVLTVSGVLDDKQSSALGFGDYPLNVGLNTINILVVSQSGSLNTYTLNVVRKECNSTRLSVLSAYEGVIDFHPDVYDYVFGVPNEVTSLTLTVETEDPMASYDVVGNADFAIGMNTVDIVVTARDGVTTATYTLSVNRQLSANNFLEWLTSSDGVLDPVFDKYTMSYRLDLPKSVNLITLDGEAESPTSSVYGLGMRVIAPGENHLNVTVISATGIERIYQVLVVRAKDDASTLSNLTVRNGATVYLLDPTFKPDVNSYDVTVDIGQTSVELVATLSANTASVSGDGVRIVVAGLNVYNVIVTAEDGTTNTYAINLTRPKSDNADLASLAPSIGVLDPTFYPNETEYEINLANSASLISFTTTTADPLASVSGDGLVVLNSGENVITITVTAEDGTTKDYVVTVNRILDNEARLSLLEVDSYNLTPAFSPSTYTYDLLVSNLKTSLDPTDVTATAIDAGASVKKASTLALPVGVTKQYKILVTAVDGFTTQEYTINVLREVDNNYLDSLTVSDGILNPPFKKDVINYSVIVQNGVTDLTVDATSESPLALINGLGNYPLIEGENVIEITVTSSGGVDRVYTLTVLRLSAQANFLNSLLVMVGGTVQSLTPEFDQATNVYALIVQDNVASVNIIATSTDAGAVIAGDGVHAIAVGENIIDVTVTNSLDEVNTYTVTVTRHSDNNYLSDLSISSGVLTPSFNKLTGDYTAVVENAVNEITISGSAEDISAMVTGLGVRSLTVGPNNFNIMVTSNRGSVRVYSLTIYRLPDDASMSFLDSLTVEDENHADLPLTPDFDPETNVYEVTAPIGTTEITIVATSDDGSAVVDGTGLKLVPTGSGIFVVTVTNLAGQTNYYTIVVSSPNMLITSDIYKVTRGGAFDYVIGAREKTTIASFIANFDNPSEYLGVYDAGGVLINVDTAYVGTGMTLRLENASNVYDELSIVVKGDINGDGLVDPIDLLMLANYMKYVVAFDDLQSLAADINTDKGIDAIDTLKLVNHIKLIGSIYD